MDDQKRIERQISVHIPALPPKRYIKETWRPNMHTMLDMEKLVMSKRTDMVSVGGLNITLAVSIT